MWEIYEKDSDRGNHYGAREKPVAREISRNPQRLLNLRFLAIVERMQKWPSSIII